MVMLAQPVPERSLQQRVDALARGNEIRTHRAQLKRDLKAGRVSVLDVLLDGDDRLATMKVYDLLLSVPKYGRVKVNRVLARQQVSPSKTLGGLSERQRRCLAAALAGASGMVRS